MRQININTHGDIFHTCDVLCVRKNIIKNSFTIYFYDHVSDAYCFGSIINIDDNYYIKNIKYSEDINLFKRIINGTKRKVDVTFLPPFLSSIDHPLITDNDILIDNYSSHSFGLKKVDYLELISYCDATNLPLYYYFRVLKMEPTVDNFIFTLKFSEVSKKKLNKNIIARHITNKSIADLAVKNDIYYYESEDEDKVKTNFDSERIIVNKLVELIKNDHKVDTILLTRIATMMLNEEDKIEAARHYQDFIRKYYDNWINEKEYTR